MEQIINDAKENFKYLLMADWCFYIPLQFFNFYYLPTKYRVLYVSMLSLVYDSILVYVLHPELRGSRRSIMGDNKFTENIVRVLEQLTSRLETIESTNSCSNNNGNNIVKNNHENFALNQVAKIQ
ncbi:mpv17-like protein [Dermatophagoides farinae]|uniref:Mpv17-like protein n=1 Tax=Dermatophagoides farinae TaxID=6954 RepID=A0A9D4P9F1_DERFA|nr:mpv17-like protein [Dermatophagoides farinae]